MDYTSGDTGGLPIYRDYRTWLYGKSSFDQTHALVFNYVWDLPDLGKRYNNQVLSYIVGYWQVSGVTTFPSGFPLGIGLATTPTSQAATEVGSMSLKKPSSHMVSAPSTVGLTLRSSAGQPRDILVTLRRTSSEARV